MIIFGAHFQAMGKEVCVDVNNMDMADGEDEDNEGEDGGEDEEDGGFMTDVTNFFGDSWADVVDFFKCAKIENFGVKTGTLRDMSHILLN